MQSQEPEKIQERSPFPWKRLLVITVLFLFIVLGAIVLLLSTGHIIDYSWYYVIPVVFAIVVGPMLTALQWLFPLSPIETKTTRLDVSPLRSPYSTIPQKKSAPTLQPKPSASKPQINQEEFELLRTLEGHAGSIYSVAVSPDGRTIASGSQDGMVKLWNLHTGDLLHTLPAYSGTVNRVAISSDGDTLVSGSADGTIKIWKLQTGELLRTIQGHSTFFMSVIISPDSQTLITGGADNTIKIWKLSTGELLNTVADRVYDVAISSDGKTLASSDTTIKIWDLQTGDLLHSWPGHSRPIYSLAISPDKRIIVSGGGDRAIKVWDLQTGALLRTLRGHSGAVNTLAMSPDGQTLASGSHDSTVRIWSLHERRPLCILTGHVGSIFTVAFSSDGKTVVSAATTDNAIRVWSKKD